MKEATETKTEFPVKPEAVEGTKRTIVEEMEGTEEGRKGTEGSEEVERPEVLEATEQAEGGEGEVVEEGEEGEGERANGLQEVGKKIEREGEATKDSFVDQEEGVLPFMPSFSEDGVWGVGNRAIPADIPFYYFEIHIRSENLKKNRNGRSRGFYLGFRSAQIKFCYSGNKGKKYMISEKKKIGKPYGVGYGTGDCVGCGIDREVHSLPLSSYLLPSTSCLPSPYQRSTMRAHVLQARTIFFTKNGVYLGTAFANISIDDPISPILLVATASVAVRYNFGGHPFVFDLRNMVSNVRYILLSFFPLPSRILPVTFLNNFCQESGLCKRSGGIEQVYLTSHASREFIFTCDVQSK
jgi:hypothetical protein